MAVTMVQENPSVTTNKVTSVFKAFAIKVGSKNKHKLVKVVRPGSATHKARKQLRRQLTSVDEVDCSQISLKDIYGNAPSNDGICSELQYACYKPFYHGDTVEETFCSSGTDYVDCTSQATGNTHRRFELKLTEMDDSCETANDYTCQDKALQAYDDLNGDECSVGTDKSDCTDFVVYGNEARLKDVPCSHGSTYTFATYPTNCKLDDEDNQLCCGLEQSYMCETSWYDSPDQEIQQVMSILRLVASCVAAAIVVGSLPALMGAVAKWKQYETCSNLCGCCGVLTIWAFGVVGSLGVLAYLGMAAAQLKILCDQYTGWGGMEDAMDKCHKDCKDAAEEPMRAICAIPNGMSATIACLALGSVMAFVSSIIVCIGFCKHKTPKVGPGQQGQELPTVQAVAVLPGK